MTVNIEVHDKYGEMRKFSRETEASRAFVVSSMSLNRIFDHEIQVTQIARVSYYPELNQLEIYCRGEMQENAKRPTHA